MRAAPLLFLPLFLTCIGALAQTVPAASAPTSQDALNLAAAVAADKPPPVCIDRIRAAFLAYKTSGDTAQIQQHLDFLTDQLCTDYLVLTSSQNKAAIVYTRSALISAAPKELEAKLISQIEAEVVKEIKTMSQQTGASSGTTGSTSLTSKGIASKFLSLASEYGALTQSGSGQTTTVQGTLAGLPLLLWKNGLAVDCSTKVLSLTPCGSHEVVDYLTRISYGVSFDTSQNAQTISGAAIGKSTSGAQSVSASGSSHSINAVSGKWIVLQGKQVDVDIKKKADAQMAALGTALLKKVSDDITFLDIRELSSTDKFSTWQQSEVADLKQVMKQDPNGDATVDAWSRAGTGLVAALGLPANASGFEAASSDIIKKGADLAVNYNAMLGLEESVIDGIAKPPILTLEYDENRPASQPSNSVVRGIYQAKLGKVNVVTLTVNGAISFYDSQPSASISGARRLRDTQFAAEAAKDFSFTTNITGKIGMTASGAYYFQFQNSPAILNVDPSAPLTGVSFTGLSPNATQVFTEKGNVNVGQLKLSIGSGSNLKIPLSVTYSNRTELITKPTWKAQIGVSYDLDSLFQAGR